VNCTSATWYCGNLSGGVALVVWFTMNGMCLKNNTIIYVARASNSKRDCDVVALLILTCERLNVTTGVRKERFQGMISIVACCHRARLCTYAARDFRLQQNGAVTRMWRSCRVQPSHKERAIGGVRCKKEGMLLQPLRWRCVGCVIHHERDVREEQHHYICCANKQELESMRRGSFADINVWMNERND